MLKLFIFNEGWAGGFCVIAKSKSAAAEIIMDNEFTKVENRKAYKNDIMPRLKEMSLTEGKCYHFNGDS